MSATISLTQTEIFTATVAVLGMMGLQPASGSSPVPVIRGQVNRVPEPNGQDFVVLWPLSRDRLALNIDTATDSIMAGSITSNVLTVAEVGNGSVLIGSTIYGTGVSVGCQVLSQLTGAPNGEGTYTTSPTADVSATTLYCGTIASLQETEITLQADIHGPASADNASRISTLFRDQFGVSAFQAQGFPIAPLYTTEPRQIPFDNGEQQVEERWVVDLCMQANIAITTTQQFADELIAEIQPANVLPVPENITGLYSDNGVLALVDPTAWPPTNDPAGFYSDGGVCAAEPGGIYNPASPPVFFGSITQQELFDLTADDLPPYDPQVPNQIYLASLQMQVSFG